MNVTPLERGNDPVRMLHPPHPRSTTVIPHSWFDSPDALREPTSTTSPPPDIRFSVLVVENDPMSRKAIIAWLRTMGAGTIHEAVTAAEARARIHAINPCDLTILNLDLPDGPGIDLVTELHNRGWPRIIVLAGTGNSHSGPSAFHAGAQAYLLKPPTPAIGTIPRPRHSNPDTNPDPSGRPGLIPLTSTPYGLSAREIGVLQLVADGHSNKEIGATLNLSEFTAKTHLTRIGRKLGTGNRVHMVTVALRAGIIH